MSIWDEPLTREEYLKRLFEAKAEQRRKDAGLPFEEKVAIVLALQEASRVLHRAAGTDSAGRRARDGDVPRPNPDD